MTLIKTTKSTELTPHTKRPILPHHQKTHRNTHHKLHGFTIIEVSLVLAVTSLLFVAFITSVTPTLRRRRFAASAESFTEFLRSTYSAVVNVENNAYGNSPSQAIYGKLVTFGEQGSDVIHVYDLLGDVANSDHFSVNVGTLAALKSVNITAFHIEETATGPKNRIINQKDFVLDHGAWLETTANREGREDNGVRFVGSLLIARSPATGSVSTFFSDTRPEIQNYINKDTDVFPPPTIITDDFRIATVDFCLASDDQSGPNHRRNIRITAPGTGMSSIQLLSLDDANPNGGSKCLD